MIGKDLTSQIDFIDQDEDLRGAVSIQKGTFFGGKGLGGIQHADAKIGLGQGMPGTSDAFLFNFARGIPQAGGIDQLNGNSEQGDRFLDGVARGTGMGGYDCAIPARQQI